MKKLLVFFAFILFYFFVNGHVSYTDTTHLTIKQMDQNDLKKFKSDKNFVYEEEPIYENEFENLLTYYWNKFWRAFYFKKAAGITPYQAVLYGIMLLAAVLIIMQFLGLKVTNLFRKTPTDILQHYELDEDIHQINFEEEISKAIREKNFALAIRLRYLKTLKLLSDKELIDWRINKTNYDYYYEINSEQQKSLFLDVTNVFEHAWYGSETFTDTRFAESMTNFDEFEKVLRHAEK